MKRTKSTKTTIFGLLTAAGVTLNQISQAHPSQVPSWLSLVGLGLSIFGPAGLGLAARDHNVSSEAAGVK